MKYLLKVLDENKNSIGEGILIKDTAVIRSSILSESVLPAFIEYEDNTYTCTIEDKIIDKDLTFLRINGSIKIISDDDLIDLFHSDDPLVQHLLNSINLSEFNPEEAKFIKLFSAVCIPFVKEDSFKELFKEFNFKIIDDFCNKGWIYKIEQFYSMPIVVFYVLKYKYRVTFSEAKDLICLINDELNNDKFEDYIKRLEYLVYALSILDYFEDEELEIAYLSNNVGKLAVRSEDFMKAAVYFDRALLIMKKVLSEDHEDIAMVYNNMGEMYRFQKDLEKALETHLSVLKMYRNKVNKDDANIATILYNIGADYFEMYNDKDSLTYLNNALEIRLKVLGENNLYTADCYASIGFIYSKMKNYDEALRLFFKDLNIRKIVHGKNIYQLDLAEDYEYIANIYQFQGKYDKAIMYFQKRLEIYENVYNEDNIELVIPYYDLGNAYKLNSDFQDALKYFLKSLKIREKKAFEVDNKYEIARFYNEIGTIYGELGDLKKGLEYCNKALKIFKEVEEPDSDVIKKVRQNVRELNKGLLKY